MKQQGLDLNLCTRRTHKMELLELMQAVVPWPEFVSQLTAVVQSMMTAPYAYCLNEQFLQE